MLTGNGEKWGFRSEKYSHEVSERGLAVLLIPLLAKT